MISLELQGSGGAEKTPCLPPEVIEHLQVLIRGIGLHAIEGDTDDLKQLQQQMSGIAELLTKDSSADDLLVSIGRALRALEDYNRRAAQVFTGHALELREMLTAMTATVLFITSSSEASVKQLNSIESKLQRATTLNDAQQLRSSLTDCLALVRNESQRLQAESRSKIAALKSDVERLSVRLKAVATDDSIDEVSGLPGRLAAEETIDAKVSSGKEFAIALFVMDRIASINGRFGRTVGDEILVNGAQMLAKRLTGVTLYRWTGPGFVAIFDSSVALSLAEIRAKQAGAMRLEKNIDSGDRTGLIVSTFSCQVQKLAGRLTPSEAVKNMDMFMAEKAAALQT